MNKSIKVFAIAALASLVTGYAAADTPLASFNKPHVQVAGNVFKHSRDSREFSYQNQPHTTAASYVKPVHQTFSHSRDSREFSYQRHSRRTTRSQAKLPSSIFTYSRDSREFEYQK